MVASGAVTNVCVDVFMMQWCSAWMMKLPACEARWWRGGVGRLLIAVLAIAWAWTGVACEMEQRQVRSSWDSLPFDQPTGMRDPRSGGDGRQQVRAGQWAIPLERFSGGNRHAQARLLMQQISRQARQVDLWIEDFDGMSTVYAGRFDSANDPRARQMLERVRETEIEGTQPFAHAHLEPLVGQDRRAGDALDLRQYSGYYTLQVAFFDDAYPGDRRDAAVDYARELREQGHQAYYYHGPNRSLVTVGLFTYQEAFITADDPLSPGARVDAYSQRVLDLQKEFPRNIANGYELIERVDGEVVGAQRSTLVRVM